jgi:hypothetical protein
MVGVQVTEEHPVQPGEVEPGVSEAGRRAAAAIDHEDPAVHDQRGGNPGPAGHRQRRASRAQQHQFGRHATILPRRPWGHDAALRIRVRRVGKRPVERKMRSK